MKTNMTASRTKLRTRKNSNKYRNLKKHLERQSPTTKQIEPVKMKIRQARTQLAPVKIQLTRETMDNSTHSPTSPRPWSPQIPTAIDPSNSKSQGTLATMLVMSTNRSLLALHRKRDASFRFKLKFQHSKLTKLGR